METIPRSASAIAIAMHVHGQIIIIALHAFLPWLENIGNMGKDRKEREVTYQYVQYLQTVVELKRTLELSADGEESAFDKDASAKFEDSAASRSSGTTSARQQCCRKFFVDR